MLFFVFFPRHFNGGAGVLNSGHADGDILKRLIEWHAQTYV